MFHGAINIIPSYDKIEKELQQNMEWLKLKTITDEQDETVGVIWSIENSLETQLTFEHIRKLTSIYKIVRNGDDKILVKYLIHGKSATDAIHFRLSKRQNTATTFTNTCATGTGLSSVLQI